MRMGKILPVLMVFMVALLLSPVISSQAEAALVNNGDGTITDTDQNIMWLQTQGAGGPDKLSTFNWAEAKTWADALVFAGYDDWRLPSAIDPATGLPDNFLFGTNNEFGHLYGLELGNPESVSDIAPFIDYFGYYYWTGTEDPSHPGDAYSFFWSYDYLFTVQSTFETKDDASPINTSSKFYITAVRDIEDGGGGGGGGGSTVPEPSTMLLLVSGLMGLVGYRRRKRMV